MQRRYSLRQRYLFVTTSVTLLMFGFAWLAQSYISSNSHQHRENLEQRTRTAHAVHQLRNSMQSIEQQLDDYLWSPSSKKHHQLHHEIDSTLLYLQQLQAQPWLKRIGYEKALGKLATDIQSMHGALNQVLTSIDVKAGMASAVDARLAHQQLQPLLTHLWEYLRVLEEKIEYNVTEDATQLNRVAGTITQGIWLLAFSGLALVLVGFLYFERGVLKPIAMVARALKAEADGASITELPHAHSLESQQLIDAFAEMRFQVQDRQRALEQQALHDSLTGLPNRFDWQRKLKQQCEATARNGSSLAVLLIGLDRFKEINDTLGHDTGDKALQLFGERLQSLSRNNDFVARLGSDEFAILLPDTAQEESVYIARKIIEAMEQPFQIAQLNLYIGCSLGITLYPKNSDSAEALNRHADIAMYAAKRHKSGFALYDRKYDTNSMHKLSLATDLREALQGDGLLYLAFQPQLSLRTQRTCGMEVLLRWDHPQHGLVRPDDFIPIAEQTGLIHPLTTWVVENTFAQMAAWRKQQLDTGIISINISVFNLQSAEFIDMLHSQLQRWDIPPDKVMLEITETAMMLDPVHAKATLQQLDALGVKLAIDDFGTGFSSLAYLKQLPVHELKIDKSFVMEMDSDENDAVIVRSTIDLAHNLGLRVVAEGVVSQDIRDLLEILDCDVIQGYLLSGPVPAAEAVKWLAPRHKGGKVRHIKDYR